MKTLESFSLQDKVAVMTGGAGKYGRQIAEALAEAGAKTIMASRNAAQLEAQARKFRDAGLDVSAMRFDQGDEASINQLLQQAVDAAGSVDILVNASVARPMGDWSDPSEAWIESMRVNATGLFCITRAFGDYMAAHGGGSIINVGSIQGMVGPDFSLYEGLDWGCPPDYFFHKGGLIQLTQFVASKLGPQGVRCNAVSPGGFFDHQEQIFVDRYNKRTCLGRMANETDLKGVIVFLASDASAYVTGANIPVDGGYVAK